MEFLFIKGDTVRNVRLSKFIACLSKMGHDVSFWGWDRSSLSQGDERLRDCRYLFRGGGFGHKVMLYYPLWMVKLFFTVLLSNYSRGKKIVAVNFDAALPVAIAACIRRDKFIYEIRDEFALSYKFPGIIKRMIKAIDHWIIRRSEFVIHVDANRITYDKGKYVVIENSPEDYWHGCQRDYDKVERVIAVIGNLSWGRGIESISTFAEKNPAFKILVVGTYYDDRTKSRLDNLRNVIHKERMPQQELFKEMECCCAIFSLYDPALEINRLAASNKVYDAMMMGIPVVTNREVVNAKSIADEGVGLVVDYEYNDTWRNLEQDDFLEVVKRMGQKGRRLYLEKYQFDKMIADRFIPMVE